MSTTSIELTATRATTRKRNIIVVGSDVVVVCVVYHFQIKVESLTPLSTTSHLGFPGATQWKESFAMMTQTHVANQKRDSE